MNIVVDRPLGSAHPRHGFRYELNYGYVPGTLSGDGAELDAYVLGIDDELRTFTGSCVAVLHRLDDDDDKLILVPDGDDPDDTEILARTHFVEQWFKPVILRQPQ